VTVPDSDVKPDQPPSRPPSRRWTWIVLGAVAAVVLLLVGLVLGFGAGLFHPHDGRSVPTFPSLAEHPDRSLHGTVAYYANDTGCVRITSASGQLSKDVLCIAPKDLTVKPQQGVKPAGPQLVWLPGDRLEVTMFYWSAPSGGPPEYSSGWQKIVDVRTGKVADVPAAQVPDTPNTTTQATTSPSGERISYTFDPLSGRAKVMLTDSTGTRTLLSVRGPGEYTYQFGPVFWAPNWQWIAAGDDGRILVITPGTPSRTRVLVTGSGGGAGGGTYGPAFAVTGSDLLNPAK
jgi:hypothetical protein